MTKVIKIRKGLNIKLKGAAETAFAINFSTNKYAIKPTDYIGIRPKLLVQPGDIVKAGTPVFYDKYNEDIVFTAPVSGKIDEVIRGDKRRLEEVRIIADEQIKHEDFGAADPKDLSKEEIIKKLLKSGLWNKIRQRPYKTIANPVHTPKSIFISGFDSAPLAPDYDFIVHNKKNSFQTGINALLKLTKGNIYLNLKKNNSVSETFKEAKNVKINYFSGPHPAGNVGIQIHHLDPINKGEIVWFINPQDVITIGTLFEKGIYDATKIIALTGSEIKSPKYYKIYNGASIENMLANNLNSENVRCISGNVLTGKKIEKSGYVGHYDAQISVIPEGDYYEFFGWASPGFCKYSVSRSFFTWLNPKKARKLDTNVHGGKRAFVMTGLYEKYLPMDIIPMHLLKNIMIEDIEMMEKLGIYEVDEEDFALCEFVCPSKTEIQTIIRNGLDLMRREMN